MNVGWDVALLHPYYSYGSLESYTVTCLCLQGTNSFKNAVGKTEKGRVKGGKEDLGQTANYKPLA